MKLRDLNAQLLRCRQVISTEQDEKGQWLSRDDENKIYMWSPVKERWVFDHVDSVAEAHGISFLCPKSYAKNGGTKGTHSVYIFFQGSPYSGHNSAGEEVRWTVVGGSTIDDLQLHPSIQEQDERSKNPCCWHGWVGSSGVPAGEAA